VLAFNKRLIQAQLSNLRAHGGLSQISDGLLVVLDVVGALIRVDNLHVKNAIDVQSYIVLSHGHLRVDIDYLLTSIQDVF
jgi:hypothetical protein